MPSALTIVGIVLSTVLGVGALVAPLYVMLLRMKREDGADDEKLDQLIETQAQLERDVSEMQDDIKDTKHAATENAKRSERNQQHIHQLLVGDHNGENGEIGNPHYTADHCPLPQECPFHDH